MWLIASLFFIVNCSSIVNGYQDYAYLFDACLYSNAHTHTHRLDRFLIFNSFVVFANCFILATAEINFVCVCVWLLQDLLSCLLEMITKCDIHKKKEEKR